MYASKAFIFSKILFMQRKLLLTTALLAFTLLTSAQTGLRKFFVSGSARFQFSERLPNISYPEDIYPNPSLRPPKNTNYFIVPQVGFFVAKKWALGMMGSYERNSQKESIASVPIPLRTGFGYTVTNAGEIIKQTWSVGVFGQHYHLFTDKFGIVSTLGAEYGKTKRKTILEGSEIVLSEPMTTTGYPIGATNGTPVYQPDSQSFPCTFIESEPKPQFFRTTLGAALIYFITPRTGLTLQTTCVEFSSQRDVRTLDGTYVARQSKASFQLVPGDFRLGLQWHFGTL